MVPADELTPKGTEIGINIYIDRALAGAWGKGERLYMQGPWKVGVPSQGYQLPLTPAQLYRAGIAATNTYCRKAYGKVFDLLDQKQREEVLIGLSTGKVAFDNELPVRVFWTTVYQTVIEGMFSDPIYGGNRNKAGWRLIGFPGAIAVHRENVEKYRDKPFPADPVSIADMSGGGQDSDKIERSRCPHCRAGLDRRHPGEGTDRVGAQGCRARAGSNPQPREGLCGADRARRAALRGAPRPHAEHRARHAHHSQQPVAGSAADATPRLVPARRGRGRLGRALERSHLALDRHGVQGPLHVRGALRQELHSCRHDGAGLGDHLRRA